MALDDYATIADAVDDRAERDPDGTLTTTVDGGSSVTAAELAERSIAVARGLARHISAGDAVLTASAPGHESIAVTVALARLGAVEVPLPAHVAADWAHELQRRTGATALVASAAALDSLPLLALGTDLRGPVIVHGATHHAAGTPLDALVADPASLPLHRPSIDHAALVMSTSGTTGSPKGAALRHSVGLGQARRVIRAMRYESDDVLYSFFPWQHINARHAAFLPMVMSGGRLLIGDGFSAGRFWDVCHDHGVTAFNFMGAVCAILLRGEIGPADRAHVVSRAYGGPAPQEMTEAFASRFGVTLLQAYACTELGDVCTSTMEDREPGAAGRPVPEHEVRVVDDDGRDVEPGVSGQIVVRPRDRLLSFDRYVGDPQATERAWRDGWFQTRDGGRLDDKGRLWFEGRSADVIRRRGINIVAGDVESVLSAHPEVIESAVVGVPSELTEDELLAVVVLRVDAAVSAAGLVQWTSDRLPRHSVPRFISIEPSLPVNASLKLERNVLRVRGVPAGAWDGDANTNAGESS